MRMNVKTGYIGSTQAASDSNDRCPTSVVGFDEILGGGLPRNCCKYLSSQLHELCSMLNQKGVVTFLILPQHGLVGTNEASVDLSYLADSVVTLRYFEAAGEVKQALAVVKKRSGQHEKSIREYKLESGRGIRMGPRLKAFQGVLSGVPVFRGASKQIIEQSDGVR